MAFFLIRKEVKAEPLERNITGGLALQKSHRQCRLHCETRWCVRLSRIISCPGLRPISDPLSFHLANLSIEPTPGLWIECERKGSRSAQTSWASAVAAVTQISLPAHSDLTLRPPGGPSQSLTLAVRIRGPPVETAIWANLRLTPGFNQSHIEATVRVNDKSVNFSPFLLCAVSNFSGLIVAEFLVKTVCAVDWLSSRCSRVLKTSRQTVKSPPRQVKWNIPKSSALLIVSE